jgi:hypothetical protein
MSSWLLSLTLYFKYKLLVTGLALSLNCIPFFHFRLIFKGFVDSDMENVVSKWSHVNFQCLLSAIAFHLIEEILQFRFMNNLWSYPEFLTVLS